MNTKINFTLALLNCTSPLKITHAPLSAREFFAVASAHSNLRGIYKKVVDGLRELLNVPPNYHVFFTGSANEIWERIIQNMVEENPFHLVNGSFSKRFFEIAQQMNKRPEKVEVALGQAFDLESESSIWHGTHRGYTQRNKFRCVAPA